MYSVSGSRVIQSQTVSVSMTPMLVVLVLQVLIMNLGIPLGPMFYPEMSILAVITTVVSGLHLFGVISILILSTVFLVSVMLRVCLPSDTKAVHMDISLQQMQISVMCII